MGAGCVLVRRRRVAALLPARLSGLDRRRVARAAQDPSIRCVGHCHRVRSRGLQHSAGLVRSVCHAARWADRVEDADAHVHIGHRVVAAGAPAGRPQNRRTDTSTMGWSARGLPVAHLFQQDRAPLLDYRAVGIRRCHGSTAVVARRGVPLGDWLWRCDVACGLSPSDHPRVYVAALGLLCDTSHHYRCARGSAAAVAPRGARCAVGAGAGGDAWAAAVLRLGGLVIQSAAGSHHFGEH